MNNFKAVIFDMDGLLLDSERVSYEAFVAACRELKLHDLSSIFYNCIGTNPEKGRKTLENGLRHIVDVDSFCSAWDSNLKSIIERDPIPLKAGVIEVLDYFSAKNTPMAVATSAVTKCAERKLFDSGILHYFEFIIGGDQVSNSKPHPEVYLNATRRFSVKPSDCLALEDSENGVRSAVAAGMTVVQIPDLLRPSKELISLGHIILKSLSEVSAYNFEGNK